MSYTYNLTAITESIHKQIQKMNNNISFNQTQHAVEASFDGLYDYEKIKKANGVLHTKLKKLGLDIARTALLDIVAMSLGHRNHHSLKSASEEFFIVSDKWYSYKTEQTTVVVGRSGNGKSILVTSEAHRFDSPDTLLIDYSNSYSLETIQPFNKKYHTDYASFSKAKHINLRNEDQLPAKAGYSRIIIDEAIPVVDFYRKQLMQLFALNPTAHLILLVQEVDDISRLGLNIDTAEQVYENLGMRPGYEDQVKAYLFKSQADNEKEILDWRCWKQKDSYPC